MRLKHQVYHTSYKKANFLQTLKGMYENNDLLFKELGKLFHCLFIYSSLSTGSTESQFHGYLVTILSTLLQAAEVLPQSSSSSRFKPSLDLIMSRHATAQIKLKLPFHPHFRI